MSKDPVSLRYTTQYLEEGNFKGLGAYQNSNIFHKTREKPQGVGFIFLLASSEIREKKPHPSGVFHEEPL